jgi:hypothetical protein
MRNFSVRTHRVPHNQLFSARQQRRYLKHFAKPKDEVLIANHSGLYLAYAALKIHSKEYHPRLKIIVPEFWLTKIDKRHNELDWGQTPLGIPWYIRQVFQKHYPKHQNNQLIKWGQVNELRWHILEQLEEFGAELYFGIPKITKQHNGYQINVDDASFNVPLDTCFYNSFQVPDIDHDLGKKLPKRSHVNLYYLSKSEVPKTIVVIGGGRSVVWLAKHFPETLIACIKYKDSKLPLFKGEEELDNILEFPREYFKSGDFKAKLDKDTGKVKIVDNKHNKFNFIGEFYCAIGLKRLKEITLEVSAEDLLIYPLHGIEWVAPEFETPRGSLIETSLRWGKLTDNFNWINEYYCYHPDYFMEYFTSEMKKSAIYIDPSFYICLKEEINLKHKALTIKQIVELYQKCYLKFYSKTDHANNTLDEDLEKIKIVIQQFEDERLRKAVTSGMRNKP